ncbi:hypothetical protein FIBSPDRAFT_827239 [Athelia psychrophila]|uniref:Uncharacterized protein n=1 Tax=Athelia psychrophila TaxID=1759441 RepID=A0A167V2M3_9AGAM|nr:hypothetical protein FIBSPDRAFT_843808 [Fibularhizoctonia sp. CBS 109695]KZP20141.1 hypothetical protein FIBSPDRAFT_827239 [Fibularhizoctonia sp. CBS 109695]
MEEAVRLLLGHGADVNAQGGHYGHALQAASYGGHYRIVALLLESKAEVNTAGGYYGHAFQAALSGGHDAVVILLLNNGADSNTHWTTSDAGEQTAVLSLLENGTDSDIHGTVRRLPADLQVTYETAPGIHGVHGHADVSGGVWRVHINQPSGAVKVIRSPASSSAEYKLKRYNKHRLREVQVWKHLRHQNTAHLFFEIIV